MTARLLAPTWREEGPYWYCRFEIGPPMNYGMEMAGQSSMQAVAHALHGLSAALYSSAAYREGRLGYGGEFGGYLGISKPWSLLDEQP